MSLESPYPTIEVWPVLNMENLPILPKKFRSPMHVEDSANADISLEGFSELRASASGQFSEKSFIHILNTLDVSAENFVTIDLREESHGFIDGTAIGWFSERDWGNLGKTPTEIITDEEHRLQSVEEEQMITLNPKTDPITLPVKQAYSEGTLMQSLNVAYLRLPVTDHCRPKDAIIDQFIRYTQLWQEQRAWVHFHCSAGKGRSSTFFVMYDMIHNAKKVALKDIFARHAAIGGVDFQAIPDPLLWKYPHLMERIEFLKTFYQYCLESDENFSISWSEWIEQRT